MKFHCISIGVKWFCPFCGRRPIEILSAQLAKCAPCRKVFKVQIPALPDPNGKTGNTECGSKRKHNTLESAMQHASELKEIPFRAQKDLVIYRCRFCDFYHVGHKGKIKRVRFNEWYLYLQLKDKPVRVPMEAETPIVGEGPVLLSVGKEEV